jgi:hypothetical protein
MCGDSLMASREKKGGGHAQLRERAGHYRESLFAGHSGAGVVPGGCPVVNEDQSWVNVDDALGVSRQLFIQRVSRVRGTYTFTSRMFVRGTAQYVSTDSDPSLYTFSTLPKSGTVSGQVLLSYKLNWQSVMFIGYGDDRMLSIHDRFEKVDRQFFVKLSYALQR